MTAGLAWVTVGLAWELPAHQDDRCPPGFSEDGRARGCTAFPGTTRVCVRHTSHEGFGGRLQARAATDVPGAPGRTALCPGWRGEGPAPLGSGSRRHSRGAGDRRTPRGLTSDTCGGLRGGPRQQRLRASPSATLSRTTQRPRLGPWGQRPRPLPQHLPHSPAPRDGHCARGDEAPG